ncbi:hypothetical protein F5Y04DRAFT_286144 [Hypomontagnella monticulosa]|nr:hypothetical protein F5Y04DRAFT_286144 [Hypomontagnella monticulosa]
MEPEFPPRAPRGYTKLANFMVYQNHIVVKQFRELAIRDLLYLQAELCDLQHDINDQARRDANSQDEKSQRYDRDWCHLRYAPGEDGKQWELAQQIRRKLREYYSAIQQYQEIEALPRPNERRRKIVHSYTLSASLGGDCGFLGRDLSDIPPYPSLLSSQHRDDLLFLGDEPANDDLLARFLIGPVLKTLHSLWRPLKKPLSDLESQGQDSRTTLHRYSDANLRAIVHVISSVMSTIVPVVSIVVLYIIQSIPLKLGLICIFSMVFSLAMSLITSARRVEIFAAAAAFASVQVVFISTTASGSS